MASCLNPIPDTDPSAQDNANVSVVPGGGPSAPSETPSAGAGSGEFNGEFPDEPAPPLLQDPVPVPGGNAADAGAPAADAGVEAGSEDDSDDNSEDEQ